MTTTIGTPGGTPDRPAAFFSGPEEFRAWLEANHATETELWMGLYKKHVPDRGLTWEQAVSQALCFGWIESVWSSAYSHENPDSELPPEAVARLRADAAASAFWEAATPTYRRQVSHWVVSAKQEAPRERRLVQFIEDSAAGRNVPFQRYGETPKWVERAAAAARAASSGADGSAD